MNIVPQNAKGVNKIVGRHVSLAPSTFVTPKPIDLPHPTRDGDQGKDAPSWRRRAWQLLLDAGEERLADRLLACGRYGRKLSNKRLGDKHQVFGCELFVCCAYCADQRVKKLSRKLLPEFQRAVRALASDTGISVGVLTFTTTGADVSQRVRRFVALLGRRLQLSGREHGLVVQDSCSGGVARAAWAGPSLPHELLCDLEAALGMAITFEPATLPDALALVLSTIQPQGPPDPEAIVNALLHRQDHRRTLRCYGIFNAQTGQTHDTEGDGAIHVLKGKDVYRAEGRGGGGDCGGGGGFAGGGAGDGPSGSGGGGGDDDMPDDALSSIPAYVDPATGARYWPTSRWTRWRGNMGLAKAGEAEVVYGSGR